MNCGERGGTRITPQMCSLTSLPVYLRGREFTEFNGMVLQADFFYQAHNVNSPRRDIPLPLVTSGCENSGNLRELALQRMKDFGAECRDVRYREVGVRLSMSSDDGLDFSHIWGNYSSDSRDP